MAHEQPPNQQQFKSKILPSNFLFQNHLTDTAAVTNEPKPLNGISNANPFVPNTPNPFSSNIYTNTAPAPLDQTIFPPNTEDVSLNKPAETPKQATNPLSMSRDDIINEAINLERMEADFELDEEAEDKSQVPIIRDFSEIYSNRFCLISSCPQAQIYLDQPFLISQEILRIPRAPNSIPQVLLCMFLSHLIVQPPTKSTGSAPQGKPNINLPPGSRSLTDSYGSFSPTTPSMSVRYAKEFTFIYLKRSHPEEWGYDPKLTVVVKGIPTENSRKSDLMTFFKDIQIPLGPDFSTKVNKVTV